MNVFDFLRHVSLTQQQLLGDCAILVGIRPLMEYDQQGHSTGKRVGSRFEVVCPQRNYARLMVKLNIVDPGISQADIDGEDKPVYISFTDFAGRIYRGSDGSLGLSCSATDFDVLDQAQAKNSGKTGA